MYRIIRAACVDSSIGARRDRSISVVCSLTNLMAFSLVVSSSYCFKFPSKELLSSCTFNCRWTSWAAQSGACWGGVCTSLGRESYEYLGLLWLLAQSWPPLLNWDVELLPLVLLLSLDAALTSPTKFVAAASRSIHRELKLIFGCLIFRLQIKYIIGCHIQLVKEY